MTAAGNNESESPFPFSPLAKKDVLVSNERPDELRCIPKLAASAPPSAVYLRIEEGGELKEEEPPIEAEPSAEPEDMLLVGVIVM